MNSEATDSTAAKAEPIEHSSRSQDRCNESSLLDFRTPDIRAAWGTDLSCDANKSAPLDYNTAQLFADLTGGNGGRTPVSGADSDGGMNPVRILKTDGTDPTSPAKAMEGEAAPEVRDSSRPALESTSPRGAALADGATEEERTKFFAESGNRLSDDVRLLWNKDNRVLAIGDQHPTVGIKQHTIDNMAAYREAGATAIGMEFLPIRSQPDLDRYAQLRRDPNASDADRESARKTVENYFRQAQESSGDTVEARKEAELPMTKQMEIIDAAIDNGIRPLAIEPNISKSFSADGGYALMHEGMRNLSSTSQGAFDKYVDPKSSPEERNAARQEMEQNLAKGEESCWAPAKSAKFFAALDEAREADLKFTGMTLPRGAEESDHLFNENLHNNRNITWAQQSAKFLNEHPDERLLLFAGTQHFQYQRKDGVEIDSLNERLQEQHGIGTTVLQFAGGDFAEPKHFNRELDGLSEFHALTHGIEKNSDGKYPAAPDSAQSVALRYTVPAQKAGVSQHGFAIRIDPEGPRAGDFIVHLPQR